MLLVLDDDTVVAYRVIAVETVDLYLFIMILASWRRGHLNQNLLDFSLFQLLQACHLVPSNIFTF